MNSPYEAPLNNKILVSQFIYIYIYIYTSTFGTCYALVSSLLEYNSLKEGLLFLFKTNQELINRIKDHKEYDFPFPNETSKSKIDVTEQIFCTTKVYKISTDYNWVRGHQD